MIADSLSAAAATPAGAAAGPPAGVEGRAVTAMSELTMGIVSRHSAEQGGAPDPLDVQLVGHQHSEHGEAVAHAAPEADLRGLLEIAGGDRDLADAHPLVDPLGDDLGVEDEIVRVGLEVDRLEVAPAVRAQ